MSDYTPETIRLYNVDPGHSQLSLSLMFGRPTTAPGLRHGIALWPITIKHGTFYDICNELGVDVQTAQWIADNSPEIKVHKHNKRLIVQEYPPSPATKAAEEAAAQLAREAQALSDKLNTPDEPHAVGPGVDLEAAGLPLDTPRRTNAAPPAGSKEDLEAKARAAELQAEMTVAPTEDAATAPAAEAAPTATDGEPSMNWTEDALRAFAQAKNITVPESGSKTVVLKAIRKGMSG